MGRDKALLKVGGRRVIDVLVERYAGRRVLVASGRRRIPRLGARQVPDPEGLEGPLAGLAAGLKAARTPWALLASCDQPPPPAGVLEVLWRRRRGLSSALTRGGRPLPFPALYHRAALARIRAGDGPRALLESLPGARIPAPRGVRATGWNTRAAFRRLGRLTLGSPPP